MSTPHLYIGNKNYSSWSLRPWLALRWGDLAFEDFVLRLGEVGHGQGKNADILAISPTGRVPALRVGDITIYESLAICEWAAEQAPHLWPADPAARAVARSAACEMHAGFGALRRDMAMNLRRRGEPPKATSDAARSDIARVETLWAQCREEFGDGGDFLFGRRSIADAMFAPVCTRFRSYGVLLSPMSQRYCDAIFADADFRAWEADAAREAWTLPGTDEL